MSTKQEIRFKIEDIESSITGMDNLGFCTGCGAEKDGCEPDARNYECDDCGEKLVFGAGELLIMGLVD